MDLESLDSEDLDFPLPFPLDLPFPLPWATAPEGWDDSAFVWRCFGSCRRLLGWWTFPQITLNC